MISHEQKQVDALVSAWVTCSARAELGLAVDKEVARTLRPILKSKFPELEWAIQHSRSLAFELLARERLVTRVAERNPECVLVELGAGFSLRFLAKPFAKTAYIAHDFPLVADIRRALFSYTEVNHVSGDVLSARTWLEIRKMIRGRSVLFVNEGLLRYLSIDEKGFVCSEINSIIAECGGCWVTADVTTDDLLRAGSAIFKEDPGLHSVVVARNRGNSFASVADAIEFFAGQGFTVRSYRSSVLSVRDLVSEDVGAEDLRNIELVRVLEMKATTGAAPGLVDSSK